MSNNANRTSALRLALKTALSKGGLKLLAGVTGVPTPRLNAIIAGEAPTANELLILEAHYG